MEFFVFLVVFGLFCFGSCDFGEKKGKEARDRELIDAWCRSQHTELKQYEDCVANQDKPEWWSKLATKPK